MLNPVLLKSLGGIRCQVYTGTPVELASLGEIMKGRESLRMKMLGQESLIVMCHLSEDELMEIGREEEIRILEPVSSYWEPISYYQASLPLRFRLKWEDEKILLSDRRTRQRLLTYFRWKWGPEVFCEFHQLEDGSVSVDLTRACSATTSLGSCLGLF